MNALYPLSVLGWAFEGAMLLALAASRIAPRGRA